MQYKYFIHEAALGNSQYCRGAVLNVGLGPGASARAFLSSWFVSRVSSVELSQPVIDAYRAQYPANLPEEFRHRIALGNAATVPGNQINPPFDFVYIDTIQNWDDAVFSDLRAVVQRLEQPGALTANGHVCIQYWADVQHEEDHRKWMTQNGWVPVVARPALARRGRGMAAQMLLYHR